MNDSTKYVGALNARNAKIKALEEALECTRRDLKQAGVALEREIEAHEKTKAKLETFKLSMQGAAEGILSDCEEL
jgi:hypothetical protein